MKPNSFVVQRTISSPIRERWTAASAHAKRSSIALSRSETASREFWVTPCEAERARGRLAIERERRPGERARPERRDRRAPAHIGEPLAVAAERLDVGEEVVRERDRLRALEVGVAGQDGPLVLAARGRRARAGADRGAVGARSQAATTKSRSSSATWSFRLRPAWR